MWEIVMDADKDVQIPYRLLAFSILLFLTLGLMFALLSLLSVSLPLVWWIMLFVVVTAILFGSNWYLGFALWFVMKLKSLGTVQSDEV
jgi:hypothetical protein